MNTHATYAGAALILLALSWLYSDVLTVSTLAGAWLLLGALYWRIPSRVFFGAALLCFMAAAAAYYRTDHTEFPTNTVSLTSLVWTLYLVGIAVLRSIQDSLRDQRPISYKG